MKATKIMTKAAILLLGGIMATSCTDLDEELYGRLTPDNYYQNEAQASSSAPDVPTADGMTNT